MQVMNLRDRKAKFILLKMLYKGYAPYARIFKNLAFNFTSDPNTTAFFEPAKGRIVANEGLDAKQICVIIRHEILHYYLQHEKRLLKHLAESRGLNYDSLEDASINELKNYLYKDSTFNIAADYEISNRGYDDADKAIVRGILLNGKKLQGLVTEDDHPDWINDSVEQMYDKLMQEKQNEPKPDDEPEWDEEGNPEDNSGDSNSSDGQSGSNSPNEDSEGSGEGDDGSSSGDSDSNSDSSENSSSDNSDNSSSNSSNSSNSSSDMSSDSNSGNSNGSGSSSSHEQGVVIHGSFRDGKFYDTNGNEVIPN